MKFLMCLLAIGFLHAEIIEIDQMADILPAIEPDSLVLFDMDDTLTDSTISLGSGAWRKWLRQTDPDHHDELTYFVAQKVPVKPVEEGIPAIVEDLQEREVHVYVLTARGLSTWYSSAIPDIDQLTNRQLLSAGLDFRKSRLPRRFREDVFDGVLYASPMKKGAFLQDFFTKIEYRPKRVIFIDDKLDQVQSVERAMEEMGVPFVGFWYTRVNTENFDPRIADIQYRELVENDLILTDSEAEKRSE